MSKIAEIYLIVMIDNNQVNFQVSLTIVECGRVTKVYFGIDMTKACIYVNVSEVVND